MRLCSTTLVDFVFVTMNPFFQTDLKKNGSKFDTYVSTIVQMVLNENSLEIRGYGRPVG